MTTTNIHNACLHAASYDVLTLVLNLSADFYGIIIHTNAEIRTCEHVTDAQCCFTLSCSQRTLNAHT